MEILKLELLEARRIQSDLKLCFKIINGLCDLDVDVFLLQNLKRTTFQSSARAGGPRCFI